MKKNHLIMYMLIAVYVYTLSFGVAYASNYVNYRGITMTNTEYNNLINLGFTEDEIYYMSEDVFNQNKNIVSTLEAVNEKYYKTIYADLNGDYYSTELTEDEYNNQSSNNMRGYVETTYKKLVTTISRNSDNTFRFKASLNWKQFPAVRSYDIIGIGFNDNVYISSGVTFVYYYCDAAGNCPDSTGYYNKKKLSTGGGVVYKLPSGDIRGLGSAIYYDVSKNNSSQTITELEMCGDYSHATATVSQSNISDYSVNINGIQLFSGLAGYYDEIPCSSTEWGGTW